MIEESEQMISQLSKDLVASLTEMQRRINQITAERDARDVEIAKHSFRLGAEWAHTSPRESLLIAAENHANQLRHPSDNPKD